jgi:hypothetical protein
VIANLLLCLIYKFNLIIGIYVQGQKQVIQGWELPVVSGIHWGFWIFSLDGKWWWGAGQGLLYFCLCEVIPGTMSLEGHNQGSGSDSIAVSVL